MKARSKRLKGVHRGNQFSVQVSYADQSMEVYGFGSYREARLIFEQTERIRRAEPDGVDAVELYDSAGVLLASSMASLGQVVVDPPLPPGVYRGREYEDPALGAMYDYVRVRGARRPKAMNLLMRLRRPGAARYSAPGGLGEAPSEP